MASFTLTKLLSDKKGEMKMQQIKINENLIDVVSVFGANRTMREAKRNSIEIILKSDYQTIVDTFVDNLEYTLIDIFETTNENGETETTINEFDKSNYCLAGDIVDHRNGQISVFMGELTDTEKAQQQAEEAENLLYELIFGEE